MIKRGRYFVPPLNDSSDFKELFKYLVSVGAGLPADQTGLPAGSWTPELLASTISQFDSNESGVELRTVQHWFQENDRGISTDNIHWLARVFGCDDPDAVSAWRVELSAANGRLAAKRRDKRSGQKLGVVPTTEAVEGVETDTSGNDPRRADMAKPIRMPGLAGRTEAIFSTHASLGLPVIVFAAATALGLMSFSLNIHSVVFTPPTGMPKQVGFLWAPNWTIVFMALLPAYFAVLINLLRTWKNEWRPNLSKLTDPKSRNPSWAGRVAMASYAYWAVFGVTVAIASGFNWVETHLIPLLTGKAGNWAVDWGRIAIFRPDLISAPSAIVFSGLVFLLNAFGSYLFFTGLIILYSVTDDFVDFVRKLGRSAPVEQRGFVERVGRSIMVGVFRCTSLGLMITILMKLQASFLLSESVDIVEWMAVDGLNAFRSDRMQFYKYGFGQSAPGHYYSFFCLIIIVAVFIVCAARIRAVLAHVGSLNRDAASRIPWVVMNGVMVLLTTTYILVGVFPGFTILLIVSFVVAAYFTIRPASGRKISSTKREYDASV
ncbi:RcgA family putative transporter [Ruegeria halocynthiae]|uniref:RcgA family putative transporter n=1 Tax=Ruegeria halocynthiae TaxID=985054 RepID=UPI00055CCAF3|nr:hypothetical protein [Ruegeria halocynthiae]